MRLGKSKIFLLFCLSFIVGVALGQYLNNYVMAISAMFFLLGIGIFWTRRRVLLVGFLGLTFLLGALRYQASFPNAKNNFVGRLYGQTVELQGIVAREPDVRDRQTNLTLKPEGYVGNILLAVGRYPEYHYGDKLRIKGKVEEPFETEDFSYKNYLSRYDTYAVMRYPKVERSGAGYGNPVKAWFLTIKQKFLTVLSQILPEPHNALVLGLLLGLKRALPTSFKDALAVAGVSHIVVISGYNISIITRNLLKTRSWWGRRAAFWLSLLTVLAFVVITGAEASVIRAAVMGMMVVLALNLGRMYRPLNALVFVGTVMVAQNPKILSFDIGFQLSFMATLGLIYLSPIFEKWFSVLPDFLGFRTNLSSTLAAQTMTLPLLMLYFDRLSVVAPLVNVLILWVIPYAMFFGFFTGLAGLLYLPLGQLLGGLVWILLEYLIRVVNFFAGLPLAAISVQINLPVVFGYYLLLAAGLAIYRYRKNFNYYLEYVRVKI